MYEYTSTVRIPIWSRWLGWLAFTQLARVRVPVWEISIYLSWWVEEYSSLGRRFDSGCREITSFVQRLVYQPSKLRSRVRVPDDVMFIFRTYMIILFSDVTPIGYLRRYDDATACGADVRPSGDSGRPIGPLRPRRLRHRRRPRRRAPNRGSKDRCAIVFREQRIL